MALEELLAFSLLPGRYQETQGSLAVIVYWAFTSGSVDLRASLFTDRIILFFTCLIFTVGLDCEIILTVKFSRSTVYSVIKLLVYISESGTNFDYCRLPILHKGVVAIT